MSFRSRPRPLCIFSILSLSSLILQEPFFRSARRSPCISISPPLAEPPAPSFCLRPEASAAISSSSIPSGKTGYNCSFLSTTPFLLKKISRRAFDIYSFRKPVKQHRVRTRQPPQQACRHYQATRAKYRGNLLPSVYIVFYSFI